MKLIVALLSAACAAGVSAQVAEFPLPGASELISQQPAGESAWHARNCTKYMHLLGPLEYGGESSVPSRIVNGDDGMVYISNMFTDFVGSGWLKGTPDAAADRVTMTFPQIIFDEDYDGEHYYYYACSMRLNDDNTDLELTENQTATLVRDADGNYALEDPEAAIGICYVFDPAIGDQTIGAGQEGCELQWFGIAYADIRWDAVNADAASIPKGAQAQRFALCHSTGARFVDVANHDGRIYIAGLAENPEACIVGEIGDDGRTVTFATNQFMGVQESGEYFSYMVAAAPDEIIDPETGEFITTIAPADAFRASLDPETMRIDFISTDTGVAISDGQSKVGGGDLYLNPRLAQQDDYVVGTPSDPEIVMYNPYDESQGFGTFNFNLPMWTDEGMIIDTAHMYYNIYAGDQIMTLTPDQYYELSEELTDIPYTFTDNYDIFSVGINHAVYLYSNDYDRIGVQSAAVADDGREFRSAIIYNVEAGVNSVDVEHGEIAEIQYLDFAGNRIDNSTSGFAIKCTRYADGHITTEKIMRH